MEFYIIFIASLFVVLFSFGMMIFPKPKPPEVWQKWCYSKTRFAKKLEKKLNHLHFFATLQIDKFHLIGFFLSCIFCFFCFVFFIIDICTHLLVTSFIGDIGILIVFLCIIILPPIYEVSLNILWSVIDKNSQRIQNTKRLNQITKKNKQK